MKRKFKMPSFKLERKPIPLIAYEDLESRSIEAHPGTMRLTRNHEPDTEGLPRRIDGYEAYDGSPRPSEASYWILGFDEGDAEMTVGDQVDGEDSSAYGELLLQVLESGTYAGGDAAGYLVLTGVSGTFQDNENLQVSAVTEAVANGVAISWGASTDALHNTYLQSAIEAARDKIGDATGSGDILGGVLYNGVNYIWRNNAGGTAAIMYKSTTSGWTACDLGEYLAFTSGGTYVVQEDDTIDGAIGGATATVKRIVVQSGAWATGDAAGYFVLYNQSGTFQAENLNVGGNSNVATIAGNSTENTLLPSGRYECVIDNFSGNSDTSRVYGVDGVNKAFEWDGSVYCPIITGMDTDTPEHVRVHKLHLFLMFPNGQLQHSSIGDPYTYSLLTGSDTLGLGDRCVGMEVMYKVLICWTRNKVGALYGSSSADWDMQVIADEAGAIEWTIQKIGNGIFLDDRGLTDITSVEEYGDFKTNVIAKPIKKFLTKAMLAKVQCSIRVKDKNQYRLYFNDKQALVITLKNNEVIGATRLLYDVQPICTWSGENSSGQEELYFGSDDGYVYQLDSGTSFNGNAIEAYLRLHFNHLKQPERKKRLTKQILEMSAPSGTNISLFVEYDYGDTSTDIQDFSLTSGGGVTALHNCGEFICGAPEVGRAEAYVKGSGFNFTFILYSNLTYASPYTLEALIVFFRFLGFKR